MKNHYLITLFSLMYLGLSLLIFNAIPQENAHLDNDSLGYEEQALTFYHQNSFVDPNNPQIPFHTNGYPFFLGLIYKIFGYSRSIVILIQVILGLLTGLTLYAIAHMIFNRTIALLCFFLFSINLGFLIFPQFILSEILLIFFLTLATHQILSYYTTRSYMAIAFAGLIFGLSITIKPVALYFPFIILPLIFLFNKETGIKKLQPLLLFSICFAIPISGYMISNKYLYGKTCISPLTNANLLLWFHAKIKAQQHNTTHNEELAHLFPLIEGNMLEQKSWINLKKSFIQTVMQKPVLVIIIWLKEVAKTFGGLYTTNFKLLLSPNIKGGDISFFNSNQTSLLKKIDAYISKGTNSLTIKIIGYLEVFWNIIRYLFIITGFLFLIRKKQWFLILFFAGYIFYFSIITGHDGCARYRLMFESIFILLSAIGIIKNNS